jgi:hypothetical protein
MVSMSAYSVGLRAKGASATCCQDDPIYRNVFAEPPQKWSATPLLKFEPKFSTHCATVPLRASRNAFGARWRTSIEIPTPRFGEPHTRSSLCCSGRASGMSCNLRSRQEHLQLCAESRQPHAPLGLPQGDSESAARLDLESSCTARRHAHLTPMFSCLVYSAT